MEAPPPRAPVRPETEPTAQPAHGESASSPSLPSAPAAPSGGTQAGPAPRLPRFGALKRLEGETAALLGKPIDRASLKNGYYAIAAKAGTTEAPWVRYTLIALALAFMLLFLVLPLAAVFAEALRKGFGLLFVKGTLGISLLNK